MANKKRRNRNRKSSTIDQVMESDPQGAEPEQQLEPTAQAPTNGHVEAPKHEDSATNSDLEALQTSVEWIQSAGPDDKIAQKCLAAMEETADLIKNFKVANKTRVESEQEHELSMEHVEEADHQVNTETPYVDQVSELAQSVLVRDLSSEVRSDPELVPKCAEPQKRTCKEADSKTKKVWRLTWPASTKGDKEPIDTNRMVTSTTESMKPVLTKKKNSLFSRLTSSPSASESEGQELDQKSQTTGKLNNPLARILPHKKQSIPASILEEAVQVRQALIIEEPVQISEQRQFDAKMLKHVRRIALLAAKTDPKIDGQEDLEEISDSDDETMRQNLITIEADNSSSSRETKQADSSANKNKEPLANEDCRDSDTLPKQESVKTSESIDAKFSFGLSKKNKAQVLDSVQAQQISEMSEAEKSGKKKGPSFKKRTLDITRKTKAKPVVLEEQGKDLEPRSGQPKRKKRFEMRIRGDPLKLSKKSADNNDDAIETKEVTEATERREDLQGNEKDKSASVFSRKLPRLRLSRQKEAKLTKESNEKSENPACADKTGNENLSAIEIGQEQNKQGPGLKVKPGGFSFKLPSIKWKNLHTKREKPDAEEGVIEKQSKESIEFPSSTVKEKKEEEEENNEKKEQEIPTGVARDGVDLAEASEKNDKASTDEICREMNQQEEIQRVNKLPESISREIKQPGEEGEPQAPVVNKQERKKRKKKGKQEEKVCELNEEVIQEAEAREALQEEESPGLGTEVVSQKAQPEMEEGPWGQITPEEVNTHVSTDQELHKEGKTKFRFHLNLPKVDLSRTNSTEEEKDMDKHKDKIYDVEFESSKEDSKKKEQSSRIKLPSFHMDKFRREKKAEKINATDSDWKTPKDKSSKKSSFRLDVDLPKLGSSNSNEGTANLKQVDSSDKKEPDETKPERKKEELQDEEQEKDKNLQKIETEKEDKEQKDSIEEKIEKKPKELKEEKLVKAEKKKRGFRLSLSNKNSKTNKSEKKKFIPKKEKNDEPEEQHHASESDSKEADKYLQKMENADTKKPKSTSKSHHFRMNLNLPKFSSKKNAKDESKEKHDSKEADKDSQKEDNANSKKLESKSKKRDFRLNLNLPKFYFKKGDKDESVEEHSPSKNEVEKVEKDSEKEDNVDAKKTKLSNKKAGKEDHAEKQHISETKIKEDTDSEEVNKDFRLSLNLPKLSSKKVGESSEGYDPSKKDFKEAEEDSEKEKNVAAGKTESDKKMPDFQMSLNLPKLKSKGRKQEKHSPCKSHPKEKDRDSGQEENDSESKDGKEGEANKKKRGFRLSVDMPKLRSKKGSKDETPEKHEESTSESKEENKETTERNSTADKEFETIETSQISNKKKGLRKNVDPPKLGSTEKETTQEETEKKNRVNRLNLKFPKFGLKKQQEETKNQKNQNEIQREPGKESTEVKDIKAKSGRKFGLKLPKLSPRKSAHAEEEKLASTTKEQVTSDVEPVKKEGARKSGFAVNFKMPKFSKSGKKDMEAVKSSEEGIRVESGDEPIQSNSQEILEKTNEMFTYSKEEPQQCADSELNKEALESLDSEQVVSTNVGTPAESLETKAKPQSVGNRKRRRKNKQQKVMEKSNANSEPEVELKAETPIEPENRVEINAMDTKAEPKLENACASDEPKHEAKITKRSCFNFKLPSVSKKKLKHADKPDVISETPKKSPSKLQKSEIDKEKAAKSEAKPKFKITKLNSKSEQKAVEAEKKDKSKNETKETHEWREEKGKKGKRKQNSQPDKTDSKLKEEECQNKSIEDIKVEIEKDNKVPKFRLKLARNKSPKLEQEQINGDTGEPFKKSLHEKSEQKKIGASFNIKWPKRKEKIHVKGSEEVKVEIGEAESMEETIEEKVVARADSPKIEQKSPEKEVEDIVQTKGKRKRKRRQDRKEDSALLDLPKVESLDDICKKNPDQHPPIEEAIIEAKVKQLNDHEVKSSLDTTSLKEENDEKSPNKKMTKNVAESVKSSHEELKTNAASSEKRKFHLKLKPINKSKSGKTKQIASPKEDKIVEPQLKESVQKADVTEHIETGNAESHKESPVNIVTEAKTDSSDKKVKSATATGKFRFKLKADKKSKDPKEEKASGEKVAENKSAPEKGEFNFKIKWPKMRGNSKNKTQDSKVDENKIPETSVDRSHEKAEESNSLIEEEKIELKKSLENKLKDEESDKKAEGLSTNIAEEKNRPVPAATAGKFRFKLKPLKMNKDKSEKTGKNDKSSEKSDNKEQKDEQNEEKMDVTTTDITVETKPDSTKTKTVEGKLEKSEKIEEKPISTTENEGKMGLELKPLKKKQNKSSIESKQETGISPSESEKKAVIKPKKSTKEKFTFKFGLNKGKSEESLKKELSEEKSKDEPENALEKESPEEIEMTNSSPDVHDKKVEEVSEKNVQERENKIPEKKKLDFKLKMPKFGKNDQSKMIAEDNKNIELLLVDKSSSSKTNKFHFKSKKSQDQLAEKTKKVVNDTGKMVETPDVSKTNDKSQIKLKLSGKKDQGESKDKVKEDKLTEKLDKKTENVAEMEHGKEPHVIVASQPNKHEQSKREQPEKLQSTEKEDVVPVMRTKIASHPSAEAVNEAGLINSIIRYPMKLFTRQEPEKSPNEHTSEKRSQTPEISSLGSLEYALTDLESTEANSAIVTESQPNIEHEHYTDLEFYDAHGSPEPHEQVSIFTMMKRIKRRSKNKDKVKTLDNRMSWPVRPTRHHSPDGGSQDSFMTPPSPVSTWVLERVARSATLGGDRRRYYDLDRNYTSRPRPWSTLDFPPPECSYVLDDHLFPDAVTPIKIPSCKSLDEKTYNVPYMDDNAFPIYEPEWPLGDSKGAIYPLLTDPKYVNCKLLARAERGSLSSYKTAIEGTTSGKISTFLKNTFGASKKTPKLSANNAKLTSESRKSPWN